jgi:hypothetical protein
MSDNVVIPQSGGGDNVGNFSSSVANTSAVTATATGAASNGVSAVANSNDSSAIYGAHTNGGIGVFGRGGPNGGEGVFGQTTSNSSAVYGKNTSGPGVTGESAQGYGLVGTGNIGVFGQSTNSFGVIGHGGDVGVYAHNTTLNPTGGTQNDVYLAAPGFAGDFHGDVSVLGKATVTVLEITGGGDLAEPFSVEDSTIVEPGTVMVIDENHPGSLKIADNAYDRKVAGIVSGANGISTGLTLQHASLSGGKTLVALTGRVFCKAEALSSPIQPGDLLTTSSLQGHAMKAVSGSSSWGAIIGKAMTGLLEGTGLILVLVNLQ